MPQATPLAAVPPASDEPPDSPDGWPRDLAGLRAELDGIDDALHDLLIRRAEVVARVGASASKTQSRVPLRPGREAAIIRRLLARHGGRLPPVTLVRMWRELLAGTTAMQRDFRIAVAEPAGSCAMTQAAREQFGALTPLHLYPNAARALDAVAAGAASIAVLPWPDDAQTWWTALPGPDAAPLHIVARLPFWAPRPRGAPNGEAFAVAPVAPDASGDDRTLVVAATPLVDARVIATAHGRVLMEIPGFVPDPGSIPARPGEHPVVLGAYAAPLTGDAG